MTDEDKPTFWNRLFGLKNKQQDGNQPEIPPPPEEPLPPITAAPPQENTRGLAAHSLPQESAPPEAAAARARRVAESLLENESLTADLPDEAAQTLINWGLTLSQNTQLTEAQHPTLRRFLRACSRFAANPNPQNLQQILKYSPDFYPMPPTPQQQTDFLNNLRETPAQPKQVLNQLKNLLTQKDTPNAPQAR